MVSASGYNNAENEIIVRICFRPELKLKQFYEALNIKNKAFVKIKSVGHKPKLKNMEKPYF